MKIAILGDNSSVHVQKWIKALAEDTSLEIFVFSNLKGVEFDHVKYFYFKKYTEQKLNYLLNVSFVRKKIKEIRPQLLHAHYASSYGLIGALCQFHPYLITGWGADIFDVPNQNFIYKKLIKYAFSKADAITVLSKMTLPEIAKLTDKKVTLVPFGIDTEKFKFISRNWARDVFRIGTARTFATKYGLEYLIEAIGIVKKKYPSIRLELIGDGPLKNKMIEQINSLGLNNEITLHGFINQNSAWEKYISILNSLDVYTVTSILDSDTFGVAGVEASACGIPVIVSDVGGLPEVIKNNVTGIVVPPKNSFAIAEAIISLIENKNQRIDMGIAGKRRVDENYDWKKNVAQMMDVYRNTIESYSLKT